MLSHLPAHAAVNAPYDQFLAVLRNGGSFNGDIATDLASRLTMATDNSVYQVLPEAVVYPRNTADIQLLFRVANTSAFQNVRFAPRGGGTGTDGQSLTPGIIIDVSRYMAQILEVNVDQSFVRVQPGVVLDQLNDTLKPFGLFFAPNVSPSSRATLGGMFSTDACGKGSCCYGRTSEHVIEVQCVLSEGTVLNSVSLSLAQLASQKQQPGIMGDIYRQVDQTVTEQATEIEQRFPKLSRFMTGYNLAKVYDTSRQQFQLNYLLSGSEGTLAVVTELRLKLTKIPQYTQLFAIQYAEFDDALCAAQALLAVKPTAIETIDDKVLQVAKNDVIYHAVKSMLNASGTLDHTKAINLVEFAHDDLACVTHPVATLAAQLVAAQGQPKAALGFYVTADAKEMNALWDLRKKSVGLLGNLPGNRRPIPFVEDTVVPPERLAEYVREFRALLDSYGLQYGMFGHVDAGCLHVRPALDMVDPLDAQLVPVLTAAVHQLVKKYGGILWGEHGQGFRSQYAPDYFGATLYQELRKIKTAFDPYNKLNPGKIATALNIEVPIVSVSGPLRGEQDRQVTPALRTEFEPILKCNGNGQCFQYDAAMVMCPSSKVTRDRVHSPKGRATVMREWLRRISQTPSTPAAYSFKKYFTKRANLASRDTDFSQQVYDAMAGCLGCKACSTACPVKVDIPRYKAQFLHQYFTRYPRRLRDYLIAHTEVLAYWQSHSPALTNGLIKGLRPWLQKIGLVDTPMVAVKTLRQGLTERHALSFSLATLKRLCDTRGAHQVVCLVQDAFSSFYQPQILLNTYDLLTQLGYTVMVLPFRPTGKGLHDKGFLEHFTAVAERNHAFYQAIVALGVALVGIEPSMTLVYRDEYPHLLKDHPVLPIQLLQEWLVKVRVDSLVLHKSDSPTLYRLFAHCSEKSLVPNSEQLWQQVFAAFGLSLEIVRVGCCGMAGAYGHESEHQMESKGIFAQSWQSQFSPALVPYTIVTGFSCRCQVKRCMGLTAKHPVEILRESLK